jgi:hypothetical protein
MGNRPKLVPQLWMCFYHLRDYRFWPLSRTVSLGKLSVLWCESYYWPTAYLLACWQPSLLGLCPILGYFTYWGFSFLVSGTPPKKRGRSYGGEGDWGSRISSPELSSFLLWENEVMGALWASIISTATLRFLWRDQQGKSVLQSIPFFMIDVDIQQNAFLPNTVFLGAGPDHPCDASGSQSCCTLCNGEYRLICAEQHCSTGE